MEWLKAIQWDHPAIVAATGAAVGGIFLIAAALLKRKKQPEGDAPNISTTVNPEFTNAPQTKIENNPSNVFEPTVKVGLDEKAVGQEVSKAVDPLRQDMATVIARFEAQLAPKQPVPDSDDPLKVKAVEFYNAGLCAYNEGEIGQALGHWLDAVELNAESALVHIGLGAALKAKSEFDAAIEHYNAALRIDPESTAAHNNLGTVLADQSELDAAVEHWNAALRIDPNHVIAHYNIGNALKDQGDLDAAIKSWSTALRIDPDYDAAHNNLGTALRSKGMLDAAIEHYNATIRINPNRATYHDNLARVLAQKKDAAAAVDALAKAIELDPRYRAWAKTDKNFDPIRDDPAFRALVDGE